jgi:hypothetical protein
MCFEDESLFCLFKQPLHYQLVFERASALAKNL